MARKKTYYRKRHRLTAAMMALFGGFIGIHKFYLRKTGTGIFYIMLFLMTSRMLFFPISTLLGFFDAMRLFIMPDSEFNRKYNRHLTNQNRDYRQTTRSKVYNKASKLRNNPFKKSGLKKYKEFELEDAIVDLKKALEIDPNDVSLYFNLACTYSLTEQKDLAFQYLKTAVDMGFEDFEKIKSHDDLAFIRIQPEFEIFKENRFRTYKSRPQSSIPRKARTVSSDLLEDDVLLSQLNKLKELRDKGVLTERDFTTERKKLFRKA